MERGLVVAKATGGTRRALVREFQGIRAREEITLELIPSPGDASLTSPPVISGMELAVER